LTRQVLPPGSTNAVLETARFSLFRLELQPQYNVGEGAEKVNRFLAGNPVIPGADPAFRPWLDRVAAWRDAGVRIERVRVMEDPPTDYQRWLRWVGAWNIEAGETLRYMTRDEAQACGLLPAAAAADWWLIDSARVYQTTYNPDFSIKQTVLDDDPHVVVQACMWRDLAVHFSHLEHLQGIATQGFQL
jgi:hypothetical protein